VEIATPSIKRPAASVVVTPPITLAFACPPIYDTAAPTGPRSLLVATPTELKITGVPMSGSTGEMRLSSLTSCWQAATASIIVP